MAGHQGPVLCARFNRDGTYVMTTGQDRNIMLWNPTRVEEGEDANVPLDGARVLRKPIKAYTGHSHEVYGVAIARDNASFVSCGADRMVLVWDVATGRAKRKLAGHAHRVNAVALNAEGSVALSAGYDKTVRCWDLRSHAREPIQTLLHARDSVSSVCVRGHVIVSGSIDGCVRAYDLRMGALRTHTLPQAVTCAAVSNDGQCVLACTLDDRARLLDLGGGDLLAQYGGAAGGSEHAGAAQYRARSYKLEAGLAADDSHVIGGSEDASIFIWELVSAECVGVLKGHTAPVCALAVHPELSSMAVLSGSHDGTARLWV